MLIVPINFQKALTQDVQNKARINMINDDSLQTILEDVLSEYTGASEDLPSSEINEEISEVASQSAAVFLERLKSRFPAKLESSKEIEQEFESAVLRTWNKPLDLLDLLFYVCLEVSSEFIMENSEKSSKHNHVQTALARQQANACLVFNEIIHLLKSGFPNGAHLHWKMLHEIACVSYFISKHGGDIAKRFLDYEVVESYYQAQAILEHQQKMDCEMLSESDFKAIKKEFDKVKKRYGADFVKKTNYPYGWVPRTVLKTRSLKEIEKAVKLDTLRSYYDMASYNMYGGPKGLMFTLGVMKKGKGMIVPVGPSNFGLADPGKSAAISLGQIMACVLLVESNVKKLVIVEALRVLVDEICDAFCEIQSEFG
jgi:hypothetical protein